MLDDRTGRSHQTLWHVALLLAACAALFLSGARSLPLLDQEEARCAEIVREMLRSGDWLVPHLFGQPYFDKPAPFFWLAAAAETLTGNAALGGRLIAALAGALGVLTTYTVGRRTFGAKAGFIGALALATSVQFWFMARWYRMDMPFAAAMWAAVACFALGARSRLEAPKRWLVWSGFYFFCAIATLFKGPAGLGLPVLILVLYLVASGQWRRIVEFFDVRGLALYLLIALPWYVAISLREPSYAYEFLFRQNVMRFGSGEFGHSWPGILFVPVLLLGFLPWTALLPAAVRRYAPRRLKAGTDRPEALLLWLAALVPLVFFSFSHTKIVGYILPCFPPLAVLVGAVAVEWIEQEDRLARGGAVALVAAFVIACVAAAVFEARVGVSTGSGLLAITLGAVGAVLMLRSLVRRSHAAFVGWATAGFVALLLYAATTIERSGYEQHSTRALAALVPDSDRDADQFLMWPRVRTSFVYYVDAELSRVRHVELADVDLVAAELNAERGVYVLVTGEGNLKTLQALCPGRLAMLGRTGDMWLVSNHVGREWPDE